MLGDIPVIFAPGSGGTPGIITPEDHNLLAWTFDPSSVTGVYQPNSGAIFLIQVKIRAAAIARKLYVHVAGSAVDPIAGQNEIGLYNSAWSRLAVVNVDSAITSTGVKSLTIPDSQVNSGSYWIGMVFNCTTATPFLGQASAITAAASLVNVGLAAANYRYARNGTGTSLPSSIIPSSNTQHDGALWAAVSA